MPDDFDNEGADTRKDSVRQARDTPCDALSNENQLYVGTMFTEVVSWNDAQKILPDADECVLVFSPENDEPVWIGFYDGEQWVSDGCIAYETPVVAWAHLPGGVR
jgi:hypothetical protein